MAGTVALGLVVSGCFGDIPFGTPPFADYTFTVPPSSSAPRDVNFDASRSDSGEATGGPIIEYIWDWNSDGIPDWESETPTTTAQLQPGSHTVSLVAHAVTAYSNPATKTVDVPAPDVPTPAPPPPTREPQVRIKPVPEQVCPQQPVEVDASESTAPIGDTIDRYEWDLGAGKFDVNTDKTAAVSYVFPKPGDYVVRTKVTDESGTTATSQMPVKVSDCGAALRASAAASQKSFTATFTSSGKPPKLSGLLKFVNSRVLRGKMHTGLFPSEAGQFSSSVPSLNGDVAARLHAAKSGSGFAGTGTAAVRSIGGKAGWTCLRIRLQTKGVAVTGSFRTIGGSGPLANQHVRGKLDALLSSQSPLAGGDTSLSAAPATRTPPECKELARRLGVR